MTKVLVLYYSAYGHIETMANAIADGAREAGATVDVKRVPELVSLDVARSSHYKLDQPAPVAKIDELANYDAIIVGTGTRFGRMTSQMASSSIKPDGWKSRWRIHIDCDPAWWPRNHAVLDHHQPAALWNDRCRP